MKKIKLLVGIFFLLLSFIFAGKSSAQTYTINTGGSVSTCSGTFYDDGGAAGNYTKGVTQTMSFCSSNGKCMSINFTSMDILAADLLEVYDGPNTNTLITKITNGNFNTKSPVLSSAGCITIKFVSSATGAVKAGWAATLSCVNCAPPPITVGGTPTLLDIQNLLFGPDVKVSNLTVNCPSLAYGIFSGPNSNIGLTDGLLLTTGKTSNAPGPNNAPDKGTDNMAPGDQCLQNFIGGTGGTPCTVGGACTQAGCNGTNTVNNVCTCTSCQGSGAVSYDACSIEFDVIPTCDSLKINYVFASEEYPEYVNSNVSDAFAFFISGPGISGGGCNNSMNMATVPGVGSIVSIDNVNSTTNSQYYVKNNNPEVGGVQYDAYTKVLTAKAKVTPCQSYHIKVVIADFGDGIYDSGVFLQKGGISCGAPSLTVTKTDAIECCKNGSFILTLAAPSPTPLTINYSLSGTATSGTDFTALPGSIVIPAGQTVVTIPVSAICDGITEGSETVTLSIGQAVCAGVITGSATLTITDPPTANAGADKTICPTTAGANLTATGGGTYSWSPAAGLSCTTCPNPVATPTINTTYIVTVTDAAGCTATDDVVINVSCGPLVTATGSTICNGATGTLTATGSAGTSPYTYSWSPNTNLSSTTGSSITASPTTTTIYTVTLTDNTGKTATATATVTVNQKPTITLSGASVCPTKCATITASGGITYSWSSPFSGTASTQSACPAATTTYSVTGTDANGCTNTGTATVTVNPLPTVTVTNLTACKDTVGSITASGAVSYAWSCAGTGATVKPSTAVIGVSTCTVTGTDANGCVNTAVSTITVKDCSTPSVTVADGTICTGNCYTISAVGVGGVGTLTYAWNPNLGTGAGPFNVCPTATTSYTVTVTDANGATASDVAKVTVNPLPTITATTASICNGGCATITASGAGTGTYTWLPTGAGSSQNVCPTTTSSYTVTGTDANGCTNTATSSVTVNPIPVISVPDASICPGGSTTLTANGASTYTWSPATGLSSTTGTSVTASPSATSTYTVCGTSVGGCSSCTTVKVSVGALIATTGPNVTICYGACTNLSSAGGTIFSWSPATGLNNTTVSNPVACPTVTTTYTVNVSDGNCSDDAVVVVTVNPAITLNVAPVNVTCFGACNGQTIVIPSGGSSPYTYAWSGGCTAAACSNVCAGSYTLTATDAIGCTATGSTTVTEPSALTMALTGSTNVSCFGLCDGTAGVSANGGTIPYTYLWTPSAGVAANATALCVGSYTCTVTDANNCSVKTSVTITQPTKVVLTSSGGSICPNGSLPLTVNGSGGTAPILYSWSPVAGLSPTTGTSVVATPTVTTVYTITGTDANGCTGGTSITVTVQPTPVINVLAATICEGVCTPLTASGANTYTWNPSSGLSSVTGSNVTACPTITTTYTIIGTSAFGCTNSTNVIVTVNQAPVISSSPAAICPNEDTTLTVTGAASYLWKPAGSLNVNTGAIVTARPTVTTTYTITGTGANGCTSTTTVVVTVNPKPVAAFNTSPDGVDTFNPTIYFNDQSYGGTINSWKWSLGDPKNTTSFIQNPSFTYPDTATNYQVRLIVTNQYGCIDTVTGTVIIHGIFTFYIPNTFTPNNDGINDGFMPKGTGIDETDYDLWIFDRWGNLIWHTTIWGEAWDGKANKGANIAQIDTYVWKVHVKEKESGTKHNYIGHVNIVK